MKPDFLNLCPACSKPEHQFSFWRGARLCRPDQPQPLHKNQKDILALMMLRLVLRTQPRSKMRIAEARLTSPMFVGNKWHASASNIMLASPALTRRMKKLNLMSLALVFLGAG